MAEKKINGRLFRVKDVLATEAIRLQVSLLKVIGGGVDRLPTIMAGMGTKGKEDPEAKAASDAALVGALADIFSKCDPDGVVELIARIAAYAEIQSKSGQWGTVDVDQDFTDRSHKKDLFPLLAFVLKEVLGDFFSDVPGAGDLQRMVKG